MRSLKTTQDADADNCKQSHVSDSTFFCEKKNSGALAKHNQHFTNEQNWSKITFRMDNGRDVPRHVFRPSSIMHLFGGKKIITWIWGRKGCFAQFFWKHLAYRALRKTRKKTKQVDGRMRNTSHRISDLKFAEIRESSKYYCNHLFDSLPKGKSKRETERKKYPHQSLNKVRKKN